MASPECSEVSPPGPAPPSLPPPRDLSHHFSESTKRRTPNGVKRFYKFMTIPGMKNMAGAFPNAHIFPFDTLEAQVALMDRFAVSARSRPAEPAHPPEGPSPPPSSPPSSSSVHPPSSSPPAAHLTVPRYANPDSTLASRVDLDIALQYATAEGLPALHSFVRQFARENLNPSVPYADGPETLLTCGATDGMNKALEMLVETWFGTQERPARTQPFLLVESFMYTTAANQARARGMGIAPVEIDSEGLMARGKGGLEDVLANWDDETGQRPRILYTNSIGQNPTGAVMPLERRREIYDICSRYDIIIIEDIPLWHVQFTSTAGRSSATVAGGESSSSAAPQLLGDGKSSGFKFLDSLVPSFLSLDTDGRVIRIDTFSKTIAPGCRLGWVTAQPAFIERLQRITELATQAPSGFVQAPVAALILGNQPAETIRRFLSLPLGRRASFTGWSMAGWVRWLEGLRGEYERRMIRACDIIEAGAHQLKHGTAPGRPSGSADRGWAVITKTTLLSFERPRGGISAWVRVHFENHPLWMARSPGGPPLDGPALNMALLMYLIREPHRLVITTGTMFSATPAVRDERGWAYVRLCYSTPDDDVLDRATAVFVRGLHLFWRIKDAGEMQSLIDEWSSVDGNDGAEVAAVAGGVAGLGVGWPGC